MAYVQSFYLDSNEECVQLEGPSEDSILMNLVIGSNQPLTHSVIGRIVAKGRTDEKEDLEEIEKTVVESSYLGFEENDLPPIYREQIRKAKQQQQNGAQKEIAINQQTFQYNESIMNDHKYFAPPPKPEQHQAVLLTNNLYTQDYNTLDVVSIAPQPKSNYLIMSNEDFDEVNGQKKKAESDFTSLQSASGYSVAETSTYTARAADKPNRDNKYHGLSAFRPVGQTTQSQYAFE